MLVRLTVKLAEIVDGVDISRHREGDIVELSERDGQMLIAERWAELIPAPRIGRGSTWYPDARAVAADSKQRRYRR